ncbi:MAG: hypothetical protein HQK49_12950 [Oligoflexia bacterium]|nr:hypothetical protein [Oligoflexia bacterium]
MANVKAFLIVILLLLITTLSTSYGSEEKIKEIELDNLDKKENISPIIIISGDGGGGHKAASKAALDSLSGTYKNVKEIFPLRGYMLNNDQRFNDYCGQEKWNLLKIMLSLQSSFDDVISTIYYNKIKEQILQFGRPRLIASVYMLGNQAYQNVAKELGIPFIIIPTDYTPIMATNIYTGSEETKNVHVFLPLTKKKDPHSYKVVTEEKELNPRNIKSIGYPIRAQFEEIAKKYHANDPKLREELVELKTKMNINDDDKSLFVSIGAKGWGESATFDYITIINENIKSLVKDGKKYHIIVAAGDNHKNFKEHLESHLNKLGVKINDQLVLHIEANLDAKGMAMRSIIATPLFKPGGSTVGEIIALQKPAIIKSDSLKGIHWEGQNLQLLEKLGLGYRLDLMKDGKVDKEDFIKVLKNYEEKVDKKSLSIDKELVNSFSSNFLKEVKAILE